ncbi:unnamed protein product [Caenorhabditis bovis]|uniref:Potassium channel domain-containing protein n=1 Tax=Caenorhabditis bovis TaxID=2654633 RepID=A0A8S1EUA5_9PELO|nr:unnamed protein product [Caenorhabditis bovis]
MESSQIWYRIIPQILLVLLLTTHLVIGALIFRYIDPDLAALPFTEVVFFEFITISTIGYGNVSPKTDAAKLFTIFFAIIGIPLLLVTLANFGKYMTKSYWKLNSFLGSKSAKTKLASDADMPLIAIFSLFFFTYLFGTITIKHNGKPYSLDDVYFSFISFATVGFGDKVPYTATIPNFVLVLLYLMYGIMLTTILFNVSNNYLNSVYHLGRRFKGNRDVEVTIGGQCITVSEITSRVAKQFHASPKEVRAILRELDGLIDHPIGGNRGEQLIL